MITFLQADAVALRKLLLPLVTKYSQDCIDLTVGSSELIGLQGSTLNREPDLAHRY